MSFLVAELEILRSVPFSVAEAEFLRSMPFFVAETEILRSMPFFGCRLWEIVIRWFWLSAAQKKGQKKKKTGCRARKFTLYSTHETNKSGSYSGS